MDKETKNESPELELLKAALQEDTGDAVETSTEADEELTKGRVFTPGVGWKHVGPRYQEDDDEDEDEDEDDEKYQKSKKKKMMKAQPPSTDLLPELDDSDGIMIEGTEFIKAQMDFNTAIGRDLFKAINALGERVAGLEAKLDQAGKLQKAQAAVMVGTAEKIESVASIPTSVRGVQTTPQDNVNGQNTPLSKAMQLGVGNIRHLLNKAITDGQISRDDGIYAMSQLECTGGDLRRMQPRAQNIMAGLVPGDK